MEEIIDYGQWVVPRSWNEVTLKMYSEIERFYEDKDKDFDVREVLHIFTNKGIDEINALPIEFLEEIMSKMLFLQEKPEEKKPTNTVEIKGERYTIHTESKLKVGEYVAADTALKGDKHNYAAILAILCRKDGEIYDSKFENEVLEDRIRMWEGVPVTEILPLIGFFFTALHNIADAYPIVFQGGGSHRPHAPRYREFSEKWGTIKTLYEICDEKIEKIGEVYQYYLSDYLQFLSYLIDKGEADRSEDEFQDNLRRMKKGRR